MKYTSKTKRSMINSIITKTCRVFFFFKHLEQFDNFFSFFLEQHDREMGEKGKKFTYIFIICSLNELCECASLELHFEKMIFHRNHICNICGLHELYRCVSSNIQLEKMTFHNIHNCNLCGLHELS